MEQTAIFGPFFAMLGLTALVWIYMYVRRIAFIQGTGLTPDQLAVPGKLAELSPAGYKEIDRARILEPVSFARGRDIVWSHPAFAERSVFARNDKEIVRVSMADEG